jgi:hypothetical protein
VELVDGLAALERPGEVPEIALLAGVLHLLLTSALAPRQAVVFVPAEEDLHLTVLARGESGEGGTSARCHRRGEHRLC